MVECLGSALGRRLPEASDSQGKSEGSVFASGYGLLDDRYGVWYGVVAGSVGIF
jgi:hypothetical protein